MENELTKNQFREPLIGIFAMLVKKDRTTFYRYAENE